MHFSSKLNPLDIPENAVIDLLLKVGSCFDLKHYQEGIQFCQQVIELDPKIYEAHFSQGRCYEGLGRIDEAIACYQEAIKIRPESYEALGLLGGLYYSQGLIEEVINVYEKGLKACPEGLKMRDNLLCAYNYVAKYSREDVFNAHKSWAEWLVERFPKSEKNFNNSKEVERKLMIGFVSSDFREHSVAYFIKPLLENLNQEDFSLNCYSNNKIIDGMTECLKMIVDRFVVIEGLKDERVMELISEDKIDILIDLSGHFDGNRLSLFAQKVAPIQISWLGYPNTTGLDTIDYRIVDEIVEPIHEACYSSERLIHLKTGFHCFNVPSENLEIGILPAKVQGWVTFGCFNMLAKINEETIKLWAIILSSIPNSRLIVKSFRPWALSTKRRFESIFEKFNVGKERLIWLNAMQSRVEHLRVYNLIDICLDTFPYNGTTTTCEALWMGIPVITYRGDTHASRVSASLLSRVDLSGLVAYSKEEYVAMAIHLANDLKLLENIRSQLRFKMLNSPLCNAKIFCTEFEKALKTIWKKWCES